MGEACKLSETEKEKLDQWIAAHGTPQQVALRCRIVVAAAAGKTDVAIAEELSVNRNTVILWRRRFSEAGLDGLWDIAPGRGRKPTYGIDKIAAIVKATLQTKPAGMTHWKLPEHGAKSEDQQVNDQQYLARPQTTAASRRNIQALVRSALRREGARYCRPLSGSA